MKAQTLARLVYCIGCSLPILAPGAALSQTPGSQAKLSGAAQPSPSPANARTAGSAREAADYFPPDTLAVARIGDVAQFRQTWQNSSFGAQAADPALEKFFASVLTRLSRLTDGLGVGVTDLWRQVDGEFSLAAVKSPQGRLRVVAVADLGDEAKAGDLVARLEKQLKSDAAELTTVKVGPTELRSWHRPGNREVANVTFFVERGRVVFGEDIETLAVTARRGETTDAETLAANDDFRHVMSRIAPGGDRSGINWYANPEALAKTSAAMYLPGGNPPEQLREMIDALGLDQVRGVGGTVWLGQGGMDSVSTTYGYLKTPVSGALRVLAMPATPQVPPDWVKEDVSLYAQINWSVDRFAGTLREMVDQSRGAGTFDKLLGSLEVADDGTTLAEVAQTINGPLHIAAEIPQNASQLLRQRAAIGFGIRNPEVLRGLLLSAAKRLQGSTERIGGAELVRLRIDLGGALPGAEAILGQEPEFELGIAVMEDAVLVSPNPDYLAETIAGRGKGRALADSPEYRQIARQFPERTSMITFQRQDGRLEGLYEQLRSGLLTSTDALGLRGGLTDFDFRSLPSFATMSRYLQTTGSFVVPETDGFRIVSLALPPREQ